MRRRIKALKKVQYDVIKTEAKFYEEVHELECKYAKLYEPLFERVSTAVACRREACLVQSGFDA